MNRLSLGNSMEALKLVIIEDEEAHFQLMRRAINKDLPDVCVYHFNDAEEFIEKQNEVQPDVILVDYLMPGMNGLELLKYLQKAHSEVPIIMITGQGDESIAVQAMKAGASDYVVKSPEFFRLLPSTIEKVVRKRKLKDSLDVVERRFKDLAENTSDWIWELDAQGRYIYSNPLVERISGYRPDDIMGRHLYDVFPEREEGFRKNAVFESISPGGPAQSFVTRLIHRDGREVMVETNSVPVFNTAGKLVALRGIDRDITLRVWAERSLRASHTFLEIANRHTGMGPLLDAFIAEVKDLTNCSAAGIRILDADGNIPYKAYNGFSKEFHEMENPLSTHCSHGMCVQVITGSVDSDLPFFTEGGSFYTNNAKRFSADLPKYKTKPIRNNCQRFGYQSIALVPILLGGGILGLLHVADTEENRVPIEIVKLLENIGMVLGAAIERVQMEEELGQSERRLRALSSRLLSAQEEERKRIAGEIHDSISSSLSAVKLGLEYNLDRLKEGEFTPESMEALVSITQTALDDSRKIMADLRPSMLDDLGVLVTINWLCRKFKAIYPKIQIQQVIGVEEAEIPEPLKIVIFRIIQESFNNIAKYSRAKRVDLSLTRENGKIELLIRDNGDGFDVAAVSSRNDYTGGLGLTSMRERVEFSGGIFSLQSAQNEGATIHATWAGVM
jgi:PAS domain S-box-containing protein